MPYIQADDKLLDPNDPNKQNEQQQQFFSSGDSGIVGGSGFSSQAPSTAGIGKGGTGGWTNIQAYLSANQGDQGGTKLLDDNVGTEFKNERTNLEQSSKTASEQAWNQLKPIKDVSDNAGQLIDQGGKDYDWKGNHGAGYNAALSSFKNALGAQYQGPKSFDYAMGEKTNRYGSNLGSDEAFNSMMNDFYAQKGGGTLNAGGRELQKQLNISNAGLTSARNRLLKDYSDLGRLRDEKVTNTATDLAKAQDQFRTAQTGIKDYLANTGSKFSGDIAKAQSDARAAYDQDFASGKSGRAGYGVPLANRTRPVIDNGGFLAAIERLRSNGLLGNDLTWSQLAKEKGFGDILSRKYTTLEDQAKHGDDYRSTMDQTQRRGNIAALDSFYRSQYGKHYGAGDAEKRKFNLIQEILGNADRQAEGFNVFGDRNPLPIEELKKGLK